MCRSLVPSSGDARDLGTMSDSVVQPEVVTGEPSPAPVLEADPQAGDEVVQGDSVTEPAMVMRVGSMVK